MSKIIVATDSHSGLSPQQAKEMGVMLLPMPFYFGEECYYEEVSLTREMFFECLSAGETVSTSQPSPEDVLNFWREGLKEYDEIVYIPMSSGLSGSCHTAMMLAMDEEFENKVFVVDNGRMSTPLVRSLMDAQEMVTSYRDSTLKLQSSCVAGPTDEYLTSYEIRVLVLDFSIDHVIKNTDDIDYNGPSDSAYLQNTISYTGATTAQGYTEHVSVNKTNSADKWRINYLHTWVYIYGGWQPYNS
jgi:hypothetical protein